MDFVSGLEKLGPALAALAVVAFVLIQLSRQYIGSSADVQKQLIEVIKTNTLAMQALRDVTQANCNQLAAHDQRVDGLGGLIERVNDTTQRTEGKVDKILEHVSKAAK